MTKRRTPAADDKSAPDFAQLAYAIVKQATDNEDERDDASEPERPEHADPSDHAG